MCADFLWKKAPQLPPSSHHPQSWKLPSQILNLNVINQTSPPHPYLLHPKIRPRQAKATNVLSKTAKCHNTARASPRYTSKPLHIPVISLPAPGHQSHQVPSLQIPTYPMSLLLHSSRSSTLSPPSPEPSPRTLTIPITAQITKTRQTHHVMSYPYHSNSATYLTIP